MPFADAESLVRGWLAGHFGAGYRVVTELPASLATVVAATPVIQVTKFGGSNSLPVLDASNIDVDTFDLAHDDKTARENSRALALQVQAALLFDFPGVTSGGGFIPAQGVSTINDPRWVPYDNTDLRRFVGSYRITIRSVPSEGVPA